MFVNETALLFAEQMYKGFLTPNALAIPIFSECNIFFLCVAMIIFILFILFYFTLLSFFFFSFGLLSVYLKTGSNDCRFVVRIPPMDLYAGAIVC